MMTDRQIFLDFRAASATSLACTPWINFYNFLTSIFSFVIQYVKKHSPSNIVYRLSKHSSCKSFDIQIFNANYIIFINKLTRKFVYKIKSLIGNFFMLFCQKNNGFFTTCRTLMFSGNRPLKDTKFLLRFFIKTRILNEFSFRGNSKTFKTYINPNNIVCFGKKTWFGFTSKKNVILPVFTCNAYSFYNSFNRAMKSYINFPYSLQINFIYMQLTSISIRRIFKGIISGSWFKAGKSGFLPFFNSFIKSFKSFIKLAQNSLAGKEVCNTAQFFISKLFKFFCLIIIAKMFSRRTISHNPLFKGCIIKFASLKHLIIYKLNLCFVWIKAVFERFKQLSFLLIFNIIFNSFFRTKSYCSNIIRPTPQSWHSCSELYKFFSQFTGGISLKLSRYFIWTKHCIFTIKKQMNMIRHYFHCFYVNINLISFFIKQFFQSLFNIIFQYIKSVLRTPNQMKFNIERFICVFHELYFMQRYNIVLNKNLLIKNGGVIHLLFKNNSPLTH